MNWSEKQIRQLAKDGKIRGYTILVKKKSTKLPQKYSRSSTALTWLEWNLMYWAKENKIVMRKEHKFKRDRKWRFDWAFPSIRVAVEFEGGVYMKTSGHNTAKHYTKDTQKYNAAAVSGWKVIRVTAANYKSALASLNEIIKG